MSCRTIINNVVIMKAPNGKIYTYPGKVKIDRQTLRFQGVGEVPLLSSRMLDEAQRFCAPIPGQIGISVETSGRTLLLPVSRCDFSWNNFRILPGNPERARRHPQNTGTTALYGGVVLGKPAKSVF